MVCFLIPTNCVEEDLLSPHSQQYFCVCMFTFHCQFVKLRSIYIYNIEEKIVSASRRNDIYILIDIYIYILNIYNLKNAKNPKFVRTNE